MAVKSLLRCICRLQVFVFICVLVAFSGCSKPSSNEGATSVQPDSILKERAAKDENFRSGKESPIPERDRTGFKGLAYYPINPALRFSARLNRFPGPKQVRLGTNSGEIRRGLRYGYFEFPVDGQTCRLQVYRLDDGSGGAVSLFIPFRDATSGRETYSAGRYMDLKENTSGVYDLDFNRAYNPYCAYNSEFSCPVPPEENTLKVAIRAGEKIYGSLHSR
jgi:hypothetical protein